MLDTKGIDVILGMDTLAKWGVHLTASDGHEVTVSASEPSGFLHQMEARPTDGIRVVSEFPDVFPDDLPGMRLNATSSFLLISCLALLLLQSGPTAWHQ